MKVTYVQMNKKCKTQQKVPLTTQLKQFSLFFKVTVKFCAAVNVNYFYFFLPPNWEMCATPCCATK
jgi:hypothetical protein